MTCKTNIAELKTHIQRAKPIAKNNNEHVITLHAEKEIPNYNTEQNVAIQSTNPLL